MKVSEVKKLLLESLIPLSLKYGYKIKKGDFSLVKVEANKFSSLYFTENHWFDQVDIMPSIEVGVIEIDDIVKKFNAYHSRTFWMNLRELKDWFDLGIVDWDKFNLEDGKKYKLFNYEDDLTSASKDIQKLFEEYGMRYIDEYGSVEGVDKLYNSNPTEEDNYHCSGFHEQSIIGLIAAKLSNNPKYDEIEHIYTQRINKHKEEDTMDEDDIERFFEVKEFLKANITAC